YSAYQHDNDNDYWQQLNEEAGFTAPSGNSGFDGISRNADLVVGSSFADGRGHAVGWVTWRENEALYHGQRDYSHCSVWYDFPAYQHDNDNDYWQQLNEEAGFTAPSGNSGFDGISRNADLVVGSSFADGRGHAVGWVTWRENEALYHGQRDYSHCSVWYDFPA